MREQLLTLKDASRWASKYASRKITPSNISYLVQYARVKKYPDKKDNICVKKSELKEYYDDVLLKKQGMWRKKLGKDLNWALSFDHLRESDTTKHVHRLHPYKGKFIPQLVEYFLNSHINSFKKQVYFNKGDIILDPFIGSGTTLIQASELGMHSVGIDVSEFNCFIAKVKTTKYSMDKLKGFLIDALTSTQTFSNSAFDINYNKDLKEIMHEFNSVHFQNPDYKHKIISSEIDEESYSEKKISQFLKENNQFLKENGIKATDSMYNEMDMSTFIQKWFSKRIKQELFHYIKEIEKIDDKHVQNVMRIILSRTARSCRATTHFDLATLKDPQIGPYYCRKHKKICTPVNSIIRHLKRYTLDTIKRIEEYSELRKDTMFSVIPGDSRTIDIFSEVERENPELHNLLKKKKISGVFTSPPYVGQIDYHEQHAYAYELFSIKRKDENEIGPLFKGKGVNARNEYVTGISQVLMNISKFIKDDGDFFIVANDKFDLYPRIAELSNLKIVQRFKRPVLNRTERDRQPYAEIIFHLKKDN